LLLLGALCATLAGAENLRTAAIYLQPITAPETKPTLLAEIQYETTDPSVSEVITYEAPELPEEARLLRVGVYDAASARWESSTSVMSVDNFSKGYSPHFTLSVDREGNYVGASCRGVLIDAGQTRDFGPQVKIVVAGQGKQPDLNKPVVLSPEGKKVVPEEKSFLQKYVHPLFSYVVAVGLTMSPDTGGLLLSEASSCYQAEEEINNTTIAVLQRYPLAGDVESS
jgi:hypothetical protein